ILGDDEQGGRVAGPWGGEHEQGKRGQREENRDQGPRAGRDAVLMFVGNRRLYREVEQLVSRNGVAGATNRCHQTAGSQPPIHLIKTSSQTAPRCCAISLRHSPVGTRPSAASLSLTSPE